MCGEDHSDAELKLALQYGDPVVFWSHGEMYMRIVFDGKVYLDGEFDQKDPQVKARLKEMAELLRMQYEEGFDVVIGEFSD